MTSFYAISKRDGVDIDHFYNAETWGHAKAFAVKMGYTLIGQERSLDEMMADLTTGDARLH